MDIHAAVSCLIFPSAPRSFVPGFQRLPSYTGTYQRPAVPLFYYQRRGLQSPDGPRQTLHWEEITAFVFVPLITLSLVHVREWWFQNMRKLGESSWLIRFTNHSFISLQVGVSMFLRTKRLYFFFLNQLNYSKAEWYHNKGVVFTTLRAVNKSHGSSSQGVLSELEDVLCSGCRHRFVTAEEKMWCCHTDCPDSGSKAQDGFLRLFCDLIE